MFQTIAPINPAKISPGPTCTPPDPSWMSPPEMVWATVVDRNAPTRFSTAATATATRGRMAPVAIGVAMAFAVSWKPLVKSNTRARAMTRTTRVIGSMVTALVSGGGNAPVNGIAPAARGPNAPGRDPARRVPPPTGELRPEQGLTVRASARLADAIADLWGKNVHKHSLALALATTLAVGAFAVLPVTTALASDTDGQATVETTAPLTVPAAPTHVKTRTVDADQLRVTWRAGGDGGSAI